MPTTSVSQSLVGVKKLLLEIFYETMLKFASEIQSTSESTRNIGINTLKISRFLICTKVENHCDQV